MVTEITWLAYLAILPEILLVLMLFIILGYKSFNKNTDGRTSGIAVAWGTGFILVITVVTAVAYWGDIASVETSTGLRLPVQHWGDMIASDPIGIVFRVMFLIALMLTSMFATSSPTLRHTEFYALLITATIGFNLMAVATDFVMLVVALETAGISLYLLAGYVSKDSRSAEAGMKYFVYGAFATALMMYGLSLLYGVTGRTNFYDLAVQLQQQGNAAASPQNFNTFLVVTAVLLIAGFGYKISAVPFHWWAPDVYEGAPAAVTGFASTASKAAGFALLMRVFTAGVVGSPVQGNIWWAMLVAITVLTMILGNLLAIYQTNIKRMLAYSSVAQAGYVLVGLVSFTPDAAGAALFYLLLYVITNIAAFGVIILVSETTGSDEMKDFYGLSRRSPYLALAMLFALLSLGGIPPAAGFFGKFFLFRAAVDAGLWWLALIGILTSFISLYYYLGIVKYIYLYRSDDDDVPIVTSRAAKLALTASTVGVVYLGIFAGPAINWTRSAADWFFSG